MSSALICTLILGCTAQAWGTLCKDKITLFLYLRSGPLVTWVGNSFGLCLVAFFSFLSSTADSELVPRLKQVECQQL